MATFPVQYSPYQLVSRTVILTGTTTYTVPTGCKAIFVECVGSGAGGGAIATAVVSAGGGGGGGGGGYSSALILNPKLTAFTVAVGAGGASAANGAQTSFDTGPSLCLAKGGSSGFGGTAGTALLFRSGGVGSSTSGCLGAVILAGGCGQNGITLSGTVAAGGAGGNSAYGAGGSRGGTSQGDGAAGTSYGGGGAGGTSLNGGASVVGGAGADGVIVVWEYV